MAEELTEGEMESSRSTPARRLAVVVVLVSFWMGVASSSLRAADGDVESTEYNCSRRPTGISAEYTLVARVRAVEGEDRDG